MLNISLFNCLHQWLRILLWLLFHSPCNPFYGTNHAHIGFYVGGRNNQGLGLFERFLCLKDQASTTNFRLLNAHSFVSVGKYYLPEGNTPQKKLGDRAGFSTDLNDALSLQFGYSQFLFSDGLKII